MLMQALQQIGDIFVYVNQYLATIHGFEVRLSKTVGNVSLD